MPELLTAFLAGRDEPCPVCGYCLRDLAAARCPECGATLELHLSSPQLRAGPWLFAIVSYALALGFDGVVAILMIAALAARPAPTWGPYGAATVFTALAGLMLLPLVSTARRRHGWTRRAAGRQWTRAVAVFVAVGVFHLAVGGAIFSMLD